MTIRAHAAAVKARLELDPVLSGATFQAKVTGSPDLYALFFMDSGSRYGDRLSGPDVSADFTVTVHSVGKTAEQAQFVAEHVFAQLMNWTPEVPGRLCGRTRHTGSVPTDGDDSISPSISYCVDEFSFTSDPV